MLFKFSFKIFIDNYIPVFENKKDLFFIFYKKFSSEVSKQHRQIKT